MNENGVTNYAAAIRAVNTGSTTTEAAQPQDVDRRVLSELIKGFPPTGQLDPSSFFVERFVADKYEAKMEWNSTLNQLSFLLIVLAVTIVESTESDSLATVARSRKRPTFSNARLMMSEVVLKKDKRLEKRFRVLKKDKRMRVRVLRKDKRMRERIRGGGC